MHNHNLNLRVCIYIYTQSAARANHYIQQAVAINDDPCLCSHHWVVSMANPGMGLLSLETNAEQGMLEFSASKNIPQNDPP